ncbi:hypothetical protein [Dactylosporangium sp. NPDC048998]|uniref:hypothetical protein n=1 Tax=Dactylosporangium sp. NPDC048998 TaxID=3363976 RepID=UPI00371597C6
MNSVASTATEVMQGWGSVVGALFSAFATIVTLMLYRHEVRTNRLERQDTEAAQARMIALRVESESVQAGQMTVLKCTCMNYSSMPITDVRMTAVRSGEAPGSANPRMRAMLGPNDQWDEIWNAGEVTWRPTGNSIELLDVQLSLDFIDAAGRQWTRVGQERPRRVFS